jgi:hypothetical protein
MAPAALSEREARWQISLALNYCSLDKKQEKNRKKVTEMDTESASQKGGNAIAGEKYALLGPYRGKSIEEIFSVDLRSASGVEVVHWQQIHDELDPILRRLGIDPKTTRYQIDFIKSDDPLAAGYYQLVGIRPLSCPEKKNRTGGKLFEDRKFGETTLSKFILGYAMVQWRSIGTQLEKVLIKPNGGKHEAAFHITRKEDLLLVAVSWIDKPGEKIVAS